jgi:hypothetical protein
VRVERRTARVLVVGAGTRFLSGMSYYTLRLANALAEVFPVATIAMRRLMPTGMYPGASRVGTVTPALHHTPDVTVLPSVDWYWLPSLLCAVVGLARWKPDVVVFQWWTGNRAAHVPGPGAHRPTARRRRHRGIPRGT